jgi:hypothetical protein
MMGARNGYYESKAKRKQKKIKTSDYTLQDHIDEAVMFSNKGADEAVQLNLLPAVPGRRVSLLVEAACPFRAHPNGGDAVSTSDGVLLTAGKYVGSNVVGERLDLRCDVACEWVADNAVGTWEGE